MNLIQFFYSPNYVNKLSKTRNKMRITKSPSHTQSQPRTYQPPLVVQPANNTLGQSIKDGIGLGIGSSLGNRLVSAIFGPPKIEMKSPEASRTPYDKCMEKYKNEIDCEYLKDNKN
jgi:hypothetical protein